MARPDHVLTHFPPPPPLFFEPQVVGGSVPRVGQRHWHRQVATGVRGSGSGQHHLHPGLARVHLPHHRVQQPGGQDPRRATNPAG